MLLCHGGEISVAFQSETLSPLVGRLEVALPAVVESEKRPRNGHFDDL